VLTTSNNLILGTAIGYTTDQMAVFVNSCRKFNNADVVMLVETDITEQKFNWLKQNNVDIIYGTFITSLSGWINDKRYLKYIDFLLESGDKYDNIFLTDVRDVVFQGNIFSNNLNGLHVFFEDSNETCGSEKWNYNILKIAYGENIANDLFNENILCSGTTVGNFKNILEYVWFQVKELEKCKAFNTNIDMTIDQATHNFLLHTNMLDHIKHENGDIVATLQNTSPEKIMIRGDQLFVYDKLPAVVHQYDRYPELVEFFNRLYKEC